MTPQQPPLAQIPADIVCTQDYARYAANHLPPAVQAWLDGGAGNEQTLHDNSAAFDRLRLAPRLLRNMAGGDTRVSVLGDTLPYPILVAPVAHQRLLHPDGERATLLGASAMGAGMVVSTQANVPLETLAAEAHAPLWFQLYIQADRAFTEQLVRRAESAGYRALVLTVDAPVSGGQRHREQRLGFALPAGIEAVNLRGMAPPPAHTARPGQSPLFGSPLLDAAPGWDDLAWLCRLTTLPVLVKGVLHPEDAAEAVARGARGVIVSNHGGRVLDSLPATVEALPAIAARVGHQVPVLLDGGVRRGTDVLKALALGASAVMVGRPCMQALATAGAPGVAHVLHILRTELETAMVLTGCRTLADISPQVLWPPRTSPSSAP